MSNRLIHETSPYLQQHAENPVDWYPWGEEALEAARTQDKPILLSIGYAACHWCHVMAHESFENPEIAALMNERFINIKVDREERPDLDTIYMLAVQMLSGQGGWPMTMFLTPSGKPFYGGTYFPPNDRSTGAGQVMAGFPRVLQAVSNAFQTQRDEIEQSAEQLRSQLDLHFKIDIPANALNSEDVAEAEQTLYQEFDSANGGFGGAPKFPPSMTLEFLLRRIHRTGSWRAREMLTTTLNRMGRGGIFDQIGGGFHRYTVDGIWLTPHFEKMLYDNALLARLYALAWQVTGEELFRRVASRTFDYVLREMTSPDGGFYSSQDADSEGEEGKFYVWDSSEFGEILSEDEATIARRFFNVVARGNFEGANILTAPSEPEQIALEFGLSVTDLRAQIDQIRLKLYDARARRVLPGRDEKILTAWNALMLRALADGGLALNRPDLAEAALKNAHFVRDNLFANGRLLRSYKDGRAQIDGYLEDYAYLIDALVSLYEATFDVAWIEWAITLADRMAAEFWDAERGCFFDTAASSTALIARPKEVFDSATPSGNSVAAEALLKLALLTDRADYQNHAQRILETYGKLAAQRPTGFGRMLTAYDFATGDVREIAFAGDPADTATQSLINVVRNHYLPWKVVALAKPETDAASIIPLLADRTPVDSAAAAYVCQHYVCQLPVTTPAELARQLGIAVE